MADDKIYRPKVTPPVEFPDGRMQPDLDTSSRISKGNISPSKIKSSAFPQKNTTKEVNSRFLNTKSKKILGNFRFSPRGAIQVGQYKEGQSGEVKISPAGVVATNTSGQTSFLLDGETGDAFFRGQIQSGSLLTGGVTIEDENGTTIIDGDGLRSTTQFLRGQVVKATPTTTTSGSYTDVAGSSFSVSTSRDIYVLYSVFMYLKIQGNGFPQNGYTATARLYDSFLGGQAIGEFASGGNSGTWYNGSSMISTTEGQPITIPAILLVEAGTHNYKLQFKRNFGGTAEISSFIISLVVLGK